MFKLRNLIYQQGPKIILNLDHLDLEANRLLLVLGPNGAGKSSLLRCLACLLTPSHGSIYFNGIPLKDHEPKSKARSIAWVPSQMQLGFDMTVLDIVMLGRYPWHLGYPKNSDYKAVRDSLQQLDIEALENRMHGTLSSGESQKVQIARALASDAECLILDEHCAHLDLGARFEMMSRLALLVKNGRSVILSSHDLYLAPRFAQSFLLLSKGQIVSLSPEPPSSDQISSLYQLKD
ncbi:MAG: ABC transporter ATP-binding protein [Proteobacteria bacterium]|nr:ABC transporter ATP-binding protein [Pseudomonadota bacterium]